MLCRFFLVCLKCCLTFEQPNWRLFKKLFQIEYLILSEFVVAVQFDSSLEKSIIYIGLLGNISGQHKISMFFKRGLEPLCERCQNCSPHLLKHFWILVKNLFIVVKIVINLDALFTPSKCAWKVQYSKLCFRNQLLKFLSAILRSFVSVLWDEILSSFCQ